MNYDCSIDVLLERSSVCVVNASGLSGQEATVFSQPEALIVWLSSPDASLSQIGLVAGLLLHQPCLGLTNFSIVKSLQ